MYEEVSCKVVTILSEYTEIDKTELTEGKKLVEDLDLSSFDMFFLISEVEKAFDIRIEIEDGFSDVITLKDLYQFIIKQIGISKN